MENETKIHVKGNWKYFPMDDGSYMRRPLTIEEKIKRAYGEVDGDLGMMYLNMEERFGRNALGIISSFKKTK